MSTLHANTQNTRNTHTEQKMENRNYNLEHISANSFTKCWLETNINTNRNRNRIDKELNLDRIRLETYLILEVDLRNVPKI